MLTQTDFDRVADWIDASYEVAVMFKEGKSVDEVWWCLRDTRYDERVRYCSSIQNAIRFWMKEAERRLELAKSNPRAYAYKESNLHAKRKALP